jgi:hypothetical protein
MLERERVPMGPRRRPLHPRRLNCAPTEGMSEFGCAGVWILVCGCLSPGVRVSEFGCAGVWILVCGCLSPCVRVSESGCAGV